MAQKTIIQLTDDMDGGEATQSFTFSVNGAEYEIDLNEKNAESFQTMLAPFVAHAHRANRKRSLGRKGGVPDGIDPKAVRAWATQQGIAIGPRGRIPQQIVERYRMES